MTETAGTYRAIKKRVAELEQQNRYLRKIANRAGDFLAYRTTSNRDRLSVAIDEFIEKYGISGLTEISEYGLKVWDSKR